MSYDAVVVPPDPGRAFRPGAWRVEEPTGTVRYFPTEEAARAHRAEWRRRRGLDKPEEDEV